MSAVIAALLVLTSSGAPQATTTAASSCAAAGAAVAEPFLREASGIAISRSLADTVWTHNDSGQPELVALDARGMVKGRVRVTGAAVGDWEDVAVAPCASGSCIYIADVGDNAGRRTHITIYRVPEPPAGASATAAATALHATYPDGPQDAEALLVDRAGRIFIVTKGANGPIALYRVLATERAGVTARLERVGEPRSRGKVDRSQQITGGAVSPDGRWVVLRTHDRLAFYSADEFFKGAWREAFSADLRALREPQGEGVAFGDDVIYVVGEAGNRNRGSTFARFSCRVP